MIGEHLTWSQAAALLCAFFFACAVVYIGMASRQIRRRRGATLLYNRGDMRPHHTTQRNTTQAVPR